MLTDSAATVVPDDDLVVRIKGELLTARGDLTRVRLTLKARDSLENRQAVEAAWEQIDALLDFLQIATHTTAPRETEEKNS